MNNVKALFRLEFKARFGRRGIPVKNLVVKYGLAGIFALAVYAVYIYFCNSVVQMFHVYENDYSLMMLFTLVSQLFLIGFGISSVIKNLYYSGDNELELRFPVDSTSMFACKMGVLAIEQFIVCVLLTLPFYICFGVQSNYGAYYYAMIPVVTLISFLFALSVANILAVPTMFISSKFRHKYLLNLVVNIGLVAGFFAFYMSIINSIVHFMKDQSLTMLSPDGMEALSKIKYVYPLSLFGEILLFRSPTALAIALPVSVLSVAAVTFCSILLSKKTFLKIILRNIESSGASFKKITVNKQRNPLFAVVERELHDIFRSSNYSFQYLVMAFAAPVMVYSCNKLSATVGSASLESITMPMITALVMMIFITIIVSFAGSCISRESNAFYLTKISPVAVEKQVLVKVALYLVVGALASIVSIAVVMIAKQLPVKDGFIIMANSIMFSTALTCFAVKLDITKPQFPVGGDGEVANGNLATFVTLFLGFGLSVGEGIFGIVGFITWNPSFTYGMLALINGVLMIASACWLLIKLPQSYNKIMER